MSRIVEDLLILSRADIGETPMEMEPVELGPVITEVYDMGATLAEARGQTVELNVEELNGIKIMGNELRLRQLFLNLIDNGVKYTKDGGQIRIDAYIRSDNVEVRVSDNGVGHRPGRPDQDFRPLLPRGQEPLAEGGRDRSGTGDLQVYHRGPSRDDRRFQHSRHGEHLHGGAAEDHG